MIMLAALGFYRLGTRGGRSEPSFERGEQVPASSLIEQNRDLQSLKNAFDGEGNAAQKFLEALPKNLRKKSPEHQSSEVVPAIE